MFNVLLGRTFAAKWFSLSLLSLHYYFLLFSFSILPRHNLSDMLLYLFSKSLIKLTKNRIEVITRKRKATEKFLKKDIADLLHSGLDINAYGRVGNSFISFSVQLISSL
jgi:hypothetical protein